MKKIKIKLINKRRELTLVLVSIMVLLLFFSGYSLGKEHSSINVNTNAKIAEPILIVENSPEIAVDGKNPKKQYDFKVKNYKEDGETNQIDLQYNIEIITTKEETISFKLYKDDQEIPLENNKTENMKLGKENTQEDNYKLEIIYEQNKSNSTKDIIQDVQIKVHSEQIKV